MARKEPIPPGLLDAERSVLGAVLLRNDSIKHVNGLAPSHFYDPRNRAVFASMVDLSARGVPIDAVTLELELGRMGRLDAIGGLAYLSGLLSVVPTADNIGHYAEAVESSGRSRLLQDDVRSLLGDPRIGPEELAARLGKVLEVFNKPVPKPG